MVPQRVGAGGPVGERDNLNG